MNNLLLIILLTILIITIFLSIKMFIRLITFFGSHLIDVKKFVEKNNLNLIDLKSPNKEDWKNNPFSEKDSNLLELLIVFFPTYTNKIIIVTDQKKEIKAFWIQIVSPFFGKNKIVKKKIDYKTKQINKSIERSTIIIKNSCPACNNKIYPDSHKCGNCGLAFI